MSAHCDCDLVIVGAGPAGLSTAVYAGAEECGVRLLDAGDRPGGQMGQSTKIKNLFGFPGGISGPELAARGIDSALGFDVDLRAPIRVHSIEPEESRFIVSATDEVFTARSVVIATGSTPRRHSAPGIVQFHGRGVSYKGPNSETSDIYSGPAYIIGGGNSAGQAAVFLAACGCDVHIVVRGEGLSASMSRYLISDIERAPNITLHTKTVMVSVHGGDRLELVALRGAGSRRSFPKEAAHLFVLLGADPNTLWLNDAVALSTTGHVLTGAAAGSPWPHGTSVPGIFAAGDVRQGSLKRVAAAVGEGAGAYFDVHSYLND